MEGEIREQVMKGRSVVGSLAGCNEREKCIYGREEGFEEQYPLTNSNIWVRELDMEWGAAIKSAFCGNELLERSVWSE